MNIHLLTKDYRGIIKVVWNNQQWKSFILWNLSWIEAIFGFAFVSISWDVFEWLNFGEYEKKYWCQDVRLAEAVVTKQFDQQRLNMEWKGSYCTLLHFVWPLVWSQQLVWNKLKPYDTPPNTPGKNQSRLEWSGIYLSQWSYLATCQQLLWLVSNLVLRDSHSRASHRATQD